MLGCTGARGRHDATIAVVRRSQIHLGFHLINVPLGVFDHLDRLFPLFLEVGLRLIDILLLHLDPSVDLLLLGLEGARRELVLFEELLDVLTFFLLLELEDLLAEFDQL
jgi:hypothetical protein